MDCLLVYCLRQIVYYSGMLWRGETVSDDSINACGRIPCSRFDHSHLEYRYDGIESLNIP
jgi:hypothetical protein